jgi:hypothetical protein
MALPVNQQNIITSAAVLLDDIFSQFNAAPQDVEVAIVSALQAAATARNGVKAAPLKLVSDSFALASSVADEVGNPKISALITDLQDTEQDIAAGKVFPALADVIADWKAAKALAK